PLTRAPLTKRTSALIATRLPLTVPAIVTGPFSTPIVPCASPPAGMSYAPITRVVDVAFQRFTACAATLRCADAGTAHAITARITATACRINRSTKVTASLYPGNAEPAHPAIQVRPVRLQPSRSLGHHAVRRLQRPLDQQAL